MWKMAYWLRVHIGGGMNQLDLGLEKLSNNGQKERRPGLQALQPPGNLLDDTMRCPSG